MGLMVVHDETPSWVVCKRKGIFEKMIGAWIKQTTKVIHIVSGNAGSKRWCSGCRKYVLSDGSECPGSIDEVNIGSDLKVYFSKGETKYSVSSGCYTRELIIEDVMERIVYYREVKAYLLKWLEKFKGEK